MDIRLCIVILENLRHGDSAFANQAGYTRTGVSHPDGYRFRDMSPARWAEHLVLCTSWMIDSNLLQVNEDGLRVSPLGQELLTYSKHKRFGIILNGIEGMLGLYSNGYIPLALLMESVKQDILFRLARE